MSSVGISSVEAYTTELRELLAQANIVKASGGIEPALTASHFKGGIENIGKLSGFTAHSQAHYAAIETACRNIFYDLLVGQVTHGIIGRVLIVQGIDINRRIVLQRNMEYPRHRPHPVRHR